jgi:hypothetical protein
MKNVACVLLLCYNNSNLIYSLLLAGENPIINPPFAEIGQHFLPISLGLNAISPGIAPGWI